MPLNWRFHARKFGVAFHRCPPVPRGCCSLWLGGAAPIRLNGLAERPETWEPSKNWEGTWWGEAEDAIHHRTAISWLAKCLGRFFLPFPANSQYFRASTVRTGTAGFSFFHSGQTSLSHFIPENKWGLSVPFNRVMAYWHLRISGFIIFLSYSRMVENLTIYFIRFVLIGAIDIEKGKMMESNVWS